MRTSDILGFLLGREESIRRIAASRSSVWVGLVLVFTAGIAREYDQTYIPHFGIRFLFPIITSLVAAALIYGTVFAILMPLRKNNQSPPPSEGGFFCFLGLFWMTAPLAWVYAFPAEHLFDSYTAAQVNIGLLIFVAVARVWLISRSISILCEVPFSRSLVSVLLISSIVMGLGSFTTSLSLVRLMGGLRHSPEETVLGNAAGLAFWLSIAGFVVFSFAHSILKERSSRKKTLPLRTEPGSPILFLAVVVTAWIAILIPQQIKLERNHHALVLLGRTEHRGMLLFLSQHQPDDFNKVKRLPPDPYEYWGLAVLPDVINALDGKEAPWVREMYLDYYAVALRHRYLRGEPDRMLLPIRHVLELPGGETWVRKQSESIEHRFNADYFYGYSTDMLTLIDRLRTLGLKIDKPEKPTGPTP